jgi:hypothetical protein
MREFAFKDKAMNTDRTESLANYIKTLHEQILDGYEAIGRMVAEEIQRQPESESAITAILVSESPELMALAKINAFFKDETIECGFRHLGQLACERLAYLDTVAEAVRSGEISDRVLKSDIVIVLKHMNYQEYLKTPHWLSTREKARIRAHNRCQICNSDERQLQVHHRTYERRGEELPEDLIVLCDECHKIFHENGKLIS